MVSTTLSISGYILGALCGALLLSGCESLERKPSLLSNPTLPTVKAEFPGNSYEYGKFIGPYRTVKSGGESLWNYAAWKLNPYQVRGPQETHSETSVIPYVPSRNQGKPHIAWLGHSTVLISLNGTTILIDPILTSPRLFHGKRLGALPVTAAELSVDLLLATHGHRDHLDKQTIKALKPQKMQAFVPLKMGDVLRRWRADVDVVEGGWYQTLTTKQGLKITLLPALHWSRRSMFDTNSVLWGSYLISDGDTTIYFAGDTGYAEHFKEIGTLFNDIDYAVLPIGSYEPAHVHQNSHMTPEEAINAFQDLNAKTMIPVHYGTYDLSDEPVNEPLARLNREIERQELPENSFRILSIGEVLELN